MSTASGNAPFAGAIDIVGIDLGTTKSAVAVWCDGGPRIIPGAGGSAVTPSVVARRPEDGRWLVGERARAAGLADPSAAVFAVKRLMGRRIGDEPVERYRERYQARARVTEAPNRPGGIEVAVGGVRLTPQEVSAKILQGLRADAERALGREIARAVITVPAYFDETQRQATRDAGRIAGLDVLRIVNEPTAACLAYGYRRLTERRTVAVYDLGGGTFDVSILTVGRGPFSVRSTNGNTELGGNDLDWRVVRWVLDRLDGPERAALEGDPAAMGRLRTAAEVAKRALSEAETVRIGVPVPGAAGVGPGAGGRELELSRPTLEGMAADWITETLDLCRLALDDADLELSPVTEVLLVGGQTRMPAVRDRVRAFFGIEPEPGDEVDPGEAVALGAAVQAGILAKAATGLVLADVVPLSLGVRTHGGLMEVLIPRNRPVPDRANEIFTTYVPNQDSVEIEVYQGERPFAADNVRLRGLLLEGIPPAPAGVPKIEVTFRVDEDGILEVTAADAQTGQSRHVRVTESTRLGDDEIEAMVREARQHAPEDEHRRRLAEAHEQVEALVRRLGALLDEPADGLPDDLVAAIRRELASPPAADRAARLATLERLWQEAVRARRVD